MTQDEVKTNLLSASQWLRMLIMAGYLLAIWVLGLVLLVVVITQTVTVLITGTPNINLQRFGALTGAYLHQIVDFLVYRTDEKPFPFAPFPDGSDSFAEPSPGPGPTPAGPGPAPMQPGSTTNADAVFSSAPYQANDIPTLDNKYSGDDTAADPYADLDSDRGGQNRN